ncbi:hypothetical protein [Kitasatospora aureofaciens]|uniref:hypothetical protein n=1 Tax=Kitasatospora aureofaciens TaxID=1894 RepID=UPI001DA3800C|nr:hypothetical protein [Kitasatospora aureofaciens]HJD80044.1 hypothetical protein [Kitasatospora aureofaciens]
MAGTRKAAVAVVLGALALTATACNDNSDSGKNAAPAAPTTAAAATTQAAPPAKVSPAVFLEQVTKKTGAAKSAKVTEDIAIGSITMKADGAMGWGDGLQGDMTMDMSGMPNADKMTASIGGTAFVYRFVPDGMYMKLGGDALKASDGRHWVHIGFDDVAKMQGGGTAAGGASTADQFKKADPVEGVRTLIASGTVTEVGQETVNGKPATHYTGVLNVANMAKANGGLTPEQVDQLKKSLATMGITSETIDVWVDADQLVVKRTEQADTKAGAMKVTVTYSDYGTPVATTAPDKSDSIEITELAKLGKDAAAADNS